MNRILTVLASLALVSVVSPAWPQNDSEAAAKLRDRIRVLKTALNALEKPAEKAAPAALHKAESESNSGAGSSIGHRKVRSSEPVAENPNDLVTRLYDLSDLFAPAPSYAARYLRDLGNRNESLFGIPYAPIHGGSGSSGAGGGMGGGMGGMGGGMGGMGGGGGMFDLKGDPASIGYPPLEILRQGVGDYDPTNVMYSATQTSMDSMIEVITATIAPDSWDESGGDASIQPLGLSLIVSNNLKAHRQIEDLFSYFRSRWGSLRTVSLRATWLWLDDSELATLVPDEDGPPRFVEGLKMLGLVDPQAWKQHLSDVGRKDSDRAPGYRASLNCYNGQTVMTQTGGQSLAFSGWQTLPAPPKDKESPPSELGFAPRVDVVQEGASLQVTPSTNTSGRFVILDVHSRVTLRPEGAATGASLSEIDPQDPNASVEKLEGSGQGPMFVTQRLSTTMRLPVDRQVLIGGMSFDVAPKAGSKSLYLFIKVSVQELRDDVAPKAAGATGPDYVPPQSTVEGEKLGRE